MNKKVILAFILGVLISGVSVYAATNYLASEIVYNNTTVENALNELYDLSNASVYTGETNITPTEADQTISSNGKRFTSDITIGAIPNTYKNLTSNTTVDATKLLDGVTAYNSNGELVTGSASTDCVRINKTFASNEVEKDIQLTSFSPNYYYISGNLNGTVYEWVYNKNIETNYMYMVTYTLSSGANLQVQKRSINDNHFMISNNSFTINFSSSWSGKTVYFIICK